MHHFVTNEFNEFRSLTFVEPGQHDDKLVATDPGDGVSGPNAALQAFGNLFEDTVADRMTEYELSFPDDENMVW